MDKSWLELRLRIPAEAADLVCCELGELGSTGTTVEERALDTFVVPDPNESPEGDYEIKAYFPADVDVEELRSEIRRRLQRLAAVYPGLEPALPEVFRVQDADWAEGWKQHFTAVRIGRHLVVKPSWETVKTEPQDVVVEIDPGMAFGTGTHGTTRLCLEAIASLYDGGSLPDRVLDVGTGSGILAIAAAALGAGRVLACDIDSESCRVAAENAALNRVSSRVEVTGAPLESLEGSFGLVVANILAEENVRLASELVGRLLPGGTLVLSGILREKESMVVSAFSAFPLSLVEILRDEDWVCLVYRGEG